MGVRIEGIEVMVRLLIYLFLSLPHFGLSPLAMTAPTSDPALGAVAPAEAPATPVSSAPQPSASETSAMVETPAEAPPPVPMLGLKVRMAIASCLCLRAYH